MATAQPWTPAEDATLRDGYATGLSKAKIAALLPGRTASAVGNRAATLGVRSSSNVTVKAVATHALNAKERRARLAVELLAKAERILAQTEQPHEYIDHGGKDFVEVRWTQDQPTPTDKLKLMQAVGVAVDRNLAIDKHDADTGVAEATSLLDAFADALAAAAEQNRTTETETAPRSANS